MTLDMFLWSAGVTAEGALIVLLWRKCVPQSLPVFFAYLCWSFATDLAVYSLQAFYPSAYPRFYWVQMVVDSIMVFVVLVELAWSVLRPIRSSLPKRSWIGIALLIALTGLLLWPLAGWTIPARLTPQGQIFFHLQQTFAILRVVVFLGMAGFSQLLSIGWRNRELQVATGLGFYSIVSLAVTVLHTHQIVGKQYQWGPRYHGLDEVVMVSYLGVLAYWVFSFATKEAERREFTPQMQSFLLAVAGAARTSRSVLTESASAKERKPGER